MSTHIVEDLGYADCEQCGGSPESLEFYWSEDENGYVASVWVGCHGGETTVAVDPRVALDMFDNWGHIPEVLKFRVRCLKALNKLGKGDR